MLQDLKMQLIQQIYVKFSELLFFKTKIRNKKIVRKCYLRILEREPDETGFRHFLSLMKTATNPEGLDENILNRILKNSEEYKNLRLAKINNQNKRIIRQCYLKVLKREPDKFSTNYYLNIMKSFINPQGINRRKLIEILENSDEYKKIKLAKKLDLKPQYIFKGLYNIKYLIRPNSVLDNAIVQNGIFNKWLCLNLKKTVDKNAVIFDVGANAGLLSLPFAKICVPQGQVYSFEPDSKVFRQMEKNIRLNNLRNIIAKRLAIQNDPMINKITLDINRAIQYNGLRNDGLSTIEGDSTYKIAAEIVSTSTIDKFVKENNIEKLDFLKIDTEGSEYKVLEGAEKTIRKFRPIIFYEYQPIVGRSIHFGNIEKSFKFIKKMGYRQYLKVKNEKTGLIIVRNYSKNLPDGDILCFHGPNPSTWLK